MPIPLNDDKPGHETAKPSSVTANTLIKTTVLTDPAGHIDLDAATKKIRIRGWGGGGGGSGTKGEAV
jgi:hypothetical protein